MPISEQPKWQDDRSILGTELLLRRISKSWVKLDSSGRLRITSAAFKHVEMSVYLSSALKASGRTPKEISAQFGEVGLASITAALARSLGQVVARDATDEEPAHGIVYGPKPLATVARRFRTEAQWVVRSSVYYY